MAISTLFRNVHPGVRFDDIIDDAGSCQRPDTHREQGIPTAYKKSPPVSRKALILAYTIAIIGQFQ